jgi:hypothetical protein
MTTLEKKTTREHYEEYSNLVDAIGESLVYSFLPEKNVDKLREAFLEDEHLNSIPLKEWDRVRTGASTKEMYKSPVYLTFKRRQRGMPLSMADCVCALKHCAIYRVLGVTAVLEDGTRIEGKTKENEQ